MVFANHIKTKGGFNWIKVFYNMQGGGNANDIYKYLNITTLNVRKILQKRLKLV